MAKRKESGIDIVASLPWPIGIVLGLLAYVGIAYGISWFLGISRNPYLSGLGKADIYTLLAWFALIVCWIGALASFLRQRKRRRLLNAQTGLDSIRAMSWRQFEMLVGEAFRRQGYAIEETGLGGADGGIDLVLRKNGVTTLVQCKQWRNQRVDVKIVREMFGLMAHHGAAAVKIVTVGDYTIEAKRFTQGKPIELIHGEALLAMVHAAKATSAQRAPQPTAPAATPSAAPTCPKCGTTMLQRENRRTKDWFWGCPNYPACRGIRAM